MARPKKAPFTAHEAAGVAAFHHIHGDPLPRRADLLQETVCALLNRLKRTDPETARQAAVFLYVLAARSAYWDKQRATPHNAIDLHREWKEYRDLLCEIALGTKTKRTHCQETILDQGRVLDRYFERHADFFQCRNLATRQHWILKHEASMLARLTVMPCFCTYGEALLPATLPRRLRAALIAPCTTGKIRDLLLACLHSTTPVQIAKIRKGSHSFTSKALLYRPLDTVIGFPTFDR